MATPARQHWPEYLMEACGLGAFMLAAAGFATLLEHPDSPLRAALTDPTARRMSMGAAMGLTAVTLIYSPWGRRSGAHLNPAVTLTFLWLGRVRPVDALAYVVAQFAGATLGLGAAALLLGERIASPEVNWVATLPGAAGSGVAFAAEAAISFAMMLTVLATSERPRLAPYTGLFAGALVATWISVEAPLSGMSMNPARTFASALWPRLWTGMWIYFTAPPLGMLAAAAARRLLRQHGKAGCAKLVHDARTSCIFCGFRPAASGPVPSASSWITQQ